MFAFIGKTLKVGVLSAVLLGLAGAGAFAVMGHGRTHAVVQELQSNLLESIDAHLDNPALMRQQIHELEREYPARIAQVQGDLAEIRHEIAQLERQVAVSDRVVALAGEDFDRLQTQVAGQIPSESGTRLISVRLDDQSLTAEAAHGRLERIRSTQAAYLNRAADARHDLGYLEKQAERLGELLNKLQGEQAEFRTQVVGLNRQIDAIARNERLIGLLEKRNQTIEECSQYEAISLHQITSKLDQIKGKQEAALDLLAIEEHSTDYEDVARSQIATEELTQNVSTLNVYTK